MSWVSEAVAALRKGESVQVRPRGGSMRGRIEDNQLITLASADAAAIAVDDVFFIRWKGNYILHIVRGIDGDRLLIGNNLGRINGWANRSDVLGRLIP